jgi:hypothetical protein
VKHWILLVLNQRFSARISSARQLRLALVANSRPVRGSNLALSLWPAFPTGIFTVIEGQMDAFGCLTPPDPSSFEVEIAIVTLKSYKSPGSDQIPAELIQAGGETLRSEIHKLINSVWNKEELPDQWQESIIVPIQKGHKTDCSNYRGISCYQLHTQFYPISFSQG